MTRSGCQICGGFGSRHDDLAHNWATEWVTCPNCKGTQTIRDGNDLNITCPTCDGDGGMEP